MTHTSWINERGDQGRDNERLEYLGDAVLELVAGEYLFNRFPNYDEGQLTQMRSSLVSTVALARLGEQLMLGETLRLGRGAAKSGARRLTSLHANAFEALIGAIFLDQGYRKAGRVFLSRIEDLSAWTDPNFKGRLQALAQERFGAPPQYRTVAAGGDPRTRQYVSQVSVEGQGTLGEGRAGTKQAAEQAAARAAIDILVAPVSKKRRRRPRAAGEPPVAVPAAVGVAAEPSSPPSAGRRRRSGRTVTSPAMGVPEQEVSAPVDLDAETNLRRVASSPVTADSAPDEGGPGEPAVVPGPRRRRRRSSPAASDSAPATPGHAVPAVAPPPAEPSAPRRRRRRGSVTSAAATALPPTPSTAAKGTPGYMEAAVAAPPAEPPLPRRRRRRGSGTSAAATPTSPAPTDSAPTPDHAVVAVAAPVVEPSAPRRRRRRGSVTSAAASPTAPGADAPEFGASASSGPEPAPTVPAESSEGAVKRRTHRGHRGGRRRRTTTPEP